jgi:hypothetical protein
MRRSRALTLALAATLTVWIGPALALDRPPSPGVPGSAAIRVADLDRPGVGRRHYRGGHHWRSKAAYVRWLHNEYVVAGYPVNQYRTPTYRWVDACCYYGYRRWW